MTDKPIITPMRLDDVPACVAVIADAWDSHVAELARVELLQMFTPGWPPFFYAAFNDGRVVGTAGYIASWLNYGIHSLLYVATLQECRRQGIATALVKRCLADIDTLGSNTMLTTYVPSFYTRLGFETLEPHLICAGKPNALMLRRCAPRS